MPASSHQDRYFVKLLIGFSSLIGSVLVIYYSILTLQSKDWYFWAIVAGFLLCSGIYFCLTAFVHKIKSDFSRRQKQREAQKSVMGD